MYPSSELESLALRRLLVCSRIRVRRVQCGQAATRLAMPLAWVDRAWAQWKTVSPLMKLMAVPLGFTLKRRFAAKRGGQSWFSRLARWAPMALGAWRFYQSFRAQATARSRTG